VRFVVCVGKDKRDAHPLYMRVCQPMRQTLKTMRLLWQEAERRIENIIAGVGRGIYSELPVWLLRQRLQGEGREARRFEI